MVSVMQSLSDTRVRRSALDIRRTRPRPLRWTRHSILVALAFVGIMTTGLGFSIGHANLNPERLYGLLLLPVLAYRLMRPRYPAIGRLLATWTLWILVLFVAAMTSSDPAAHLPPLLLALVPVAYFAIVTEARLDGALVNYVARLLLWAYSISGIAVLLAFHEFRSNRNLFNLIDSSGRLKLTVIEPNLFGSAMGFLLLITLPRARLGISTVTLYSLALITLAGALSKGPLLSIALGVVFFGLFKSISQRTNLTRAIVVPLWFAAVGGALLLIVLPSATNIYDKFLSREDSLRSRTYLLKLAISNFWSSPIIGRGPGDFGLQNVALLKAVGGQDSADNLWIWQMMVNIMHDSGFLGLLIYCVFLFMLLRRGFEWVRAGSLDHCGYLAAFLSLLIASQAATVHLSGIFGLAAGLVAALPLATWKSMKA